MGASLLITLREGLEISLVIAIVLAYLSRSGRQQLFRPVWIGAISAMVVCAIAGVAFDRLAGDFTGRTEQAVEGTLALVAASVLTWMIFWMRKHARGMSGSLHTKIDGAADRSHTAVALVAFAAVAREGFETALFLSSARVNGTSGASVVVGGFIGLVIAAGIGVVVYRSGNRVNLRRFFQVTGALLILFAAGLFAKSMHEFRELLSVEGWLGGSAWNVTSGAFGKGWFNDFLAGMFGWAPDADRIRPLAYVLYLIPVGFAFFAKPRPSNRAPVSASPPRSMARS